MRISYEEAREILGDRFVSPNFMEIATTFRYSEEQLEELKRSLPSKEEILRLEETGCYLVVGPPTEMSFVEVMNDFFGPLGVKPWYNEELFANDEKVGCRWYVITTKTDTNNIPQTAAVILWALIIIDTKGPIRIRKRIPVSSRTDNGEKMTVGWPHSLHPHVEVVYED